MKTPPFIFFQKSLATIREYFRSQSLIEVLPKTLQPSGAMEPYLDTFSIEGETGHPFLPTSPEFELKKIFAAYKKTHSDFPGLFALTSAFRNEPESKSHLKEFTMCEWYRQDANPEKCVADVLNLIEYFPEARLDTQNIYSVTVADFFEESLGFRLTPETSAEEYKRLCHRANITITDPETPSGITSQTTKEQIRKLTFFSVLIDTLTRKEFQENKIYVLKNFPPFTRALSELTDEGWSDRAEVFIGRMEIANAYKELSSPTEIQQEWEANNQIRKALGFAAHPMDTDLIYASRSLKNTAGMALGVERFLCAITGLDDVRIWRDYG